MSKQMTSRWRISFAAGSLAAVAALAPLVAFAQETSASGAEEAVGGVNSSSANQPGGLPNTGGGPVAQTGTTIGRPITLPNTGGGPGTADGMPVLILAGAGVVLAGSGALLRRRHASTEN